MKRCLSFLLAAVLLLCAGCGAPTVGDVGAVNEFFAMDTVMRITVYGDSGEAAASAARSEIERLEKEMKRVVTSGTGTRAALEGGYVVAGKTGSAEASNDKSIAAHAWFVGYITNDNAPYAIGVLVENGGSGGGVAAPLARKTLQKAINLGL